MLSKEFHDIIAGPARTLNFIWAAFMAAPVFYVVVAWLIARPGDEAVTTGGGGPDPVLLRGALVVVGVLMVAASFVVWRLALSPKALRERMDADGTAVSLTNVQQAAQLQGLTRASASLPSAEQRLVKVFPHYQTIFIIVMALRESLAIFGLVLTILTGEFFTVVPWVVVSVALMASQPPTVKSFMEKNLDVARAMI